MADTDQGQDQTTDVADETKQDPPAADATEAAGAGEGDAAGE